MDLSIHLGHRLIDLMSKGKVEIRVRRAFTSFTLLDTIVRLSEVRLGKRWMRRGRKGMVSLVIVTKNRIRLVMYRNCLETRESDMKLRLSPWRYLKVHSNNSSRKHEHISSAAAAAAAAIVTDNESDSFTCSLTLYMVCLFAPSPCAAYDFFLKIKTLLGPTKNNCIPILWFF